MDTAYRKLHQQTVLLVALSFVLGCNEFMIVGILSNIASDFNVNMTQVGFLVTIFALIYAICTPIITALTSHFNKYTCLIILVIIFIFSNILTGLATDFTILLVARIIAAVVSGPIVSLALAYSTVIAPMAKRSFVVSWIFSGFSIAAVFGVPLGTIISQVVGWRYVFYAIAVIACILILLIGKILPKWQPESGRIRENQFKIMKDKRVLLGSFVIMFSAGGIYVFYTYLQPFLTKVLGFESRYLSGLLFIYGVMSLFSNQLSGVIANRNGIKAMQKIYLAELMVFLSLAWFMQIQFLATLIVFVIGLFMYLINSPIMIHFLKIAELEYPSSIVLASSLNSIFFNLGIFLGSGIGGVIVSNYGIRNIPLGSMFLIFITFLLVVGLNYAIKKRPYLN
ncbi:putative MFS family arabinose efflux permease [Weissella beninensis]|uniref:MFS transporter n=1 Tax=Periweissella beninensis TaxID=504936 RepID=A0ABT0VJR8_9LACO|nr:MFS transporter [Periweissella beninensis]MBM7543681.1 putative MFS family arabinose efflux permease [Periweissella beninensis]MCM2436660.1 MFS transporter [Periweissella beninensis]